MDLEEIQQLIVEDMAGTLTPEQKEHLQQALANEPAAYTLWQEMQQVIPPSKVQEIQNGLRMEKPGEIVAAYRQHKKKKYLLKAVSIAAVTLLTAVACWQLLFKPYPGASNKELLADNKHISLRVGNGQTIDLSNAGTQVQADSLVLHNTQKTLHYTATASTTQLITLNIPAGKDYTVVLSDGTEIQLNAASTLIFPSAFTGSTREVSIQGEAFLKVSQQVNKPFLVHLPDNTVQVLGTSFNVNTYDAGQVKVALVSGALRVKSGTYSVLLKPGYQVASNATGMQATAFDEEEVLSWRKGIYEFYNVPFSAAARVISRWYGVEFVIDNPALNNKQFTGVIDRNKPVKFFLDNMQATNGLKYSIEGEVIHIK